MPGTLIAPLKKPGDIVRIQAIKNRVRKQPQSKSKFSNAITTIVFFLIRGFYKIEDGSIWADV